jgi:predicted nucleotidyltransferase component of viral defense system
MTDIFFINVLPELQFRLLKDLSTNLFIHDFYLAGGTCLALQIGHRRSIDFDFFTPGDFNTSLIINKLYSMGSYERSSEDKNTINGSLNGIRISFFGYNYKLIDDLKIFNGIKLAGLKDIAAMKLEAIAGRGSRKDFIDMFFLLKRYSLEEIFSFHMEKYGIGLSNQYHHLKSLVYFEDAETEAMPVMIQPLNWDNVKNYIIACAREFKL